MKARRALWLFAGLLVLLISTFFAWGGFFLIIPMISVHYVDQLGWSAASIGLVAEEADRA